MSAEKDTSELTSKTEEKKIIFNLLLFTSFHLLFAFEMIEIPEIKYVRKDSNRNFQMVTIDSFYMSKDDITLNDWSEYLDKSTNSNSIWKAKYYKDDFSINDQIDYMKFKMSSFGTIDEKYIVINREGPIYWINFNEAVKYCNFLSEQENLQTCYSISINEYGTEKISWNRNANGYRLPTLAEWEAVSEIYSKKLDETYLNKTNNYLFKTEKLNELETNSFGLINILNCIGKYLWDYYDVNYKNTLSSLKNPLGSDTFTPNEESVYYKEPIYEVRLYSKPFEESRKIDDFIEEHFDSITIDSPSELTIRLCRSKK